MDNDSDGRTDFPNDPDCASLDDNDEHSYSGSVFLSVTDGKDRVLPGGSSIYAVTVSTNDNFTQTVNLDLQLPSYVDYVAASGGGHLNGSTVQWPGITVSRGNPATFTAQVNVSANAPEGVTIAARATAGGQSATDTTLVRSTYSQSAIPSFEVSITDNETSVLPGDDLHYIIRVKNLENVGITTDVRSTISPFIAFVYPNGTSDQDSTRILWSQQYFGPNEERTFTFDARAEERARRNEVIRVSASVTGTNDVDTTTIRSTVVPHNLDVDISDGETSTARGDLLKYTVTVHNNENGTATHVFVGAALPIYGSFVSATNGGMLDGANVRWNNVDVPANGDLTLQYTVLVRDDAPVGNDLLASASVDGVIAYDRTRVGVVSNSSTSTSSRRRFVPTTSARPSSSTSSPRPIVYVPPVTTTSSVRSVTRASETLLISKTSDRSQVLVGGSVRFRITVRNITSAPLTNLTVTDRFNAAQWNIVDAANGRKVNDGSLEWSLPTLQPGDTWSVSYVLSAKDSVAAGTTITNLAAISGDGLDQVSLDKRLSATKISVLNSLPTTGAPFDLLSLLFAGSLAIVPAALQRKLKA